MSQRAFLADLDADLHIALADAGMADTGTYTAPASGALPVSCRAYVDNNLARLGEYGETYGATAIITLLRADVAAPAAGGVVSVDGSSYTLRQPLDADDGISVWIAA